MSLLVGKKKVCVWSSNLFTLCVALEDEGAERGLSLLIAIAPISALDHESHQPPVLLMGCKLGNLSELELREEHWKKRWGEDKALKKKCYCASEPGVGINVGSIKLTLILVTWVWGSINLLGRQTRDKCWQENENSFWDATLCCRWCWRSCFRKFFLQGMFSWLW